MTSSWLQYIFLHHNGTRSNEPLLWCICYPMRKYVLISANRVYHDHCRWVTTYMGILQVKIYIYVHPSMNILRSIVQTFTENYPSEKLTVHRWYIQIDTYWYWTYYWVFNDSVFVTYIQLFLTRCLIVFKWFNIDMVPWPLGYWRHCSS